MRGFVLYLFVLCLMLAVPSAVIAQHLSLFDIDASQYPRISAKFYAFDAQRQQMRPALNDVSVVEDARPRTVLSVNCPPQSPPLALSSVLVMDVSGSMSLGKSALMNIELAKLAANVWISGLPLGRSECALVSFDDENYLNQDFTSNAAKLYAAADSLKPLEGTDYDKGLLLPSAGGLVISERGKYKRVIVFLTDGESSKQTNVTAIVAEAQRQNCAVYCVTLGMGCPQTLRDIADQTGGMWFENLLSAQDVNDVYYTILQDAQGGTPCTVEWLSDFACEVPERSVVMGWNGTTSERTYRSAPNAVTNIVVDPQPVYMRSKPIGMPFDTTITITNGIAATTVSNITSSHPAFDVNPKAFTLTPGQSITLQVSFTPVDSSYTYTTFTLESDICRTAFYAISAYPGARPKLPTLRVVDPNGGERYASRSDTIITWTGIPPTERVRIECSSDSGSTWMMIAESTTGSSYLWRVPSVPGDKYLIRVTQLPPDTIPHTQASLVLVGHSGLIIDVDWDTNGDRVVTASNDFSAKIWDAKTGYVIHNLAEHTSGLSKVRFSPDGAKVATSGNDMRLLIWDAVSGTRLLTLTGHTASIRGIGWSPDGNKLVSLSWNGEGRLWNTQTGAMSHLDIGHSIFTLVAWHPAGDTFALGGFSGSIVHTTPASWLPSRGFSPCGPTNALEWGDDGAGLLGGCQNGDGYIWRKWGRNDQPIVLKGHTLDVNDVTWSPDGTKVATASADSTVKIWDSKTGILQRTLDKHASAVQQVDWSSNGALIASSSEDTAFVWVAATGRLLEKLVGHNARITKLEWSPDGKRIVTSSNDSTARIWDVDAGLQRDTSDTTFSVIAPQPLTQDIDMGRVLVGVSKDSVVTTILHNAGTLAFRVDEILIEGGDAPQFGIVSGAPPFKVEPGESRAVEFRFSPTSAGIKSAALTISTQNDTLRRTISGEGILPSLEFVSKIIDFGAVDVGRQKDTLGVAIVKNISNEPVVIRATRHAGPNVINFSTLASPAPLTLQPGDTARIDLRFAPTSIGRTSGRLLIDYEGTSAQSSAVTGSPASITLFGEGRASGPLISASALVFADLVCQSTTNDSIEVYNLGVGNLVVTAITLGGPDAAEFALDNVVFPVTVAPDSAKFIPLVFNPAQVGTKNAELVFTSNSFVDSVFVVPITAHKDGVSFTTLEDIIDLGVVCPEQVLTTSIAIANTGTVATHIRVDAPGVQLSTNSLSLPHNATSEIGVTVPVNVVGATGTIDVVVTLTDTVCNTRKDVRIIGIAETPELFVPDLTIVGVVGGVAITKQLVIRNPTSHVIRIPAEPLIAPFTFSASSFPLTVPAHDSVVVGVGYTAPDTTTRAVDVVLKFYTVGMTDDSPDCTDSATARVFGRGVNAYAKISIGRVAGYPGDIIDVPLVLEDVNLNASGATTINVQLRTNATLLDPLDASQIDPTHAPTRGIIEDNERVINYEFPIAAAGNGVLATLRFKVMLGNDSVTPVALLNAQAIGADVLVESVDGEFNLLGTCMVGGARLLNPGGTARIVGLTPNPADNDVAIDVETIERGKTSIVIVDAMGREVARVFDGELVSGARSFHFDTNVLGNGNYFVKMQTPTVVHTAMLRVFK